jgi:hypothetical protein
MIYQDALKSSFKTTITGEGGKSQSQFKHVINIKNRVTQAHAIRSRAIKYVIQIIR